MNKTPLLCAALLGSLLVGCGGGGDDASVTPGTATADAYVGTWKGPCKESRLSTDTTPQVPLREYVTFQFVKASDSKLSILVKEDFYTSADCSGSPRVSHTNSSALNALSIDGASTIAGAVTHQVTFTEGPLGGGIQAGGSIILNGIVYPGNFFVDQSVGKTLARVDGTSIKFSSDGPLDAQGYPTTFVEPTVFVKQ